MSLGGRGRFLPYPEIRRSRPSEIVSLAVVLLGFVLSNCKFIAESLEVTELLSITSVEAEKLRGNFNTEINYTKDNTGEWKGTSVHVGELRILPVTPKPTGRVTVKIELRGFSDKVTFYVPGVWIKGNRFSSDKPYSPLRSTRWIFREDRMPIPSVIAFDEEKKNTIALLKIPARYDFSEDPYFYPETTVQNTEITGLGFDHENRRILISIPFEEFPFYYRRKILTLFSIVPPTKNYVEIDSPRNHRFFVIRIWNMEFPDVMSYLWKISYRIFEENGVFENLRADRGMAELILLNIVQYFRRYYFDDGRIAGFFSFVWTKDGAVFMRFLEAGFTGMTLINGANSVFLGYHFDFPDLIQMGRNVIDSWIRNGRRNGFFVDCFSPESPCDLRPIFYSDSFFTRRNFESLLGLYMAFLHERDERVRSEWKRAFLDGAYAVARLQLRDGSFARRYSFDGTPIETLPSGTYFAVPVLLKAYEMSGDSSFLHSAARAGEVLHNLSRDFAYFGSTIDANSEDKEASMWTFISCYMLYRLSKIVTDLRPEREKYRLCSIRALYASLWWFFLWNVPFSPSQDFRRLGLETFGLSSVSVENIHVDVYLFFFPSLVREFAAELPPEERRILQDFSESMLAAAMRRVPIRGDEKGSTVGVIPEVIHQTWWDYGFGGKGSYNVTSATGWTVASTIVAIINHFYRPLL